MHACMPIMYVYECMFACMCTYVDGGKGGAMGLQPHLILRVLLIFYHGSIFSIQ